MSLPTRKLTVTINGQRRGPMDVPEGIMMIDVLHEMLDLTGSRLGCGVGICHACVVIWDRDEGGHGDGCEHDGDGNQLHQTAKSHAPSRVRPGVARITSRTAW